MVTMAAEGGAIVTFIFTGEDGEVIPQNATHIVMHESVTVIPFRAFLAHPNIIEVYCHAGVKKVERYAFYECPGLRRVVIPGVEVVEKMAFAACFAMTHVECPKLEIIGTYSFYFCQSLVSINLISARIIGRGAFYYCEAMTEATFSTNLESVSACAFGDCSLLERVVIPLKKGLITHEGQVFAGCGNMVRVDLVKDEVLRNTIDALNLQEWRDDLIKEIDSINLTLPNADAEYYDDEDEDGYVDMKSMEIENWTRGLYGKIVRYKVQHRLLLEEAATTLQLALSNDIVMNHVIPFLKLPSHTFGDGQRTLHAYAQFQPRQRNRPRDRQVGQEALSAAEQPVLARERAQPLISSFFPVVDR